MNLQDRVLARSKEVDKAKTESLDLGNTRRPRATRRTQHLSTGSDHLQEVDSKKLGLLAQETTLSRVIPPKTQLLEDFLYLEDLTQPLPKDETLQVLEHTTQ